ncbi:MAG: hypothetical protein WCP85_11450 [Mariniphaga sp.]
MKITRSNYESWFLDYLEGNLDPSLSKEFQSFLEQNPDLALELEDKDLIKLSKDEGIHFGGKDQLKKSIVDAQIEFQERSVAYLEGDLPLNERIDFEMGLSNNPVLSEEVRLFRTMKLIADQSILFPEKRNLKKGRGRIIPLWTKFAAVAAVILLAYLLYQPDQNFQVPINKEVAILTGQTDKDSVLSERKTKGEEKPAIKIPRINQTRKVPAVVPEKHKSKSIEEKPEKSAVPIQQLRSPEAEPSLLKLKGVNLGQPGDIELAVSTLNHQISISNDLILSELLKAQLSEMRNSGDREFLSTEHLGVSGLHLFAKLTGKRLTARKDEDGTVKSISYNSKLLAFSIPVNK